MFFYQKVEDVSTGHSLLLAMVTVNKVSYSDLQTGGIGDSSLLGIRIATSTPTCLAGNINMFVVVVVANIL